MGDSTHPLKTGQLVIEGDIVYLAYDENDPSNTDRTKINGIWMDQMLAGFDGRRVRITVDLLPEA